MTGKITDPCYMFQSNESETCFTLIRVSPFRLKNFFAYKRKKANLDPFHLCFTISLYFALLHFGNFCFEVKQSEAKFKSILSLFCFFSLFSLFFAFFHFFRFKFFPLLRFSNFCFEVKQSKAKFKSIFSLFSLFSLFHFFALFFA